MSIVVESLPPAVPEIRRVYTYCELVAEMPETNQPCELWEGELFKRGDIVIVDLGFAAKVRPCVVLSAARPDRTCNLSAVVPVTREIRGGDGEVPFPKPVWLREASVINVLGIAGVDQAKVQRRLGALPPERLDAVLETLCRVVGVESKHLAA